MIAKVLYEMFLNGLERFNLYYSNYRAIVYDNNDKDGYNRVQLIVPQFDKTIPYATWAWPKGNFAGNNYGINMLPQKGDLVWVEFEHGNRNYPIWSHAYFTKAEKPKEFDSPNTYGLKTPYGFTVLLKDDAKVLSITTPAKLSMEFDDNKGTVVIKNSKGNIYQFGEDKSLQDAGGNAIIYLNDGKIYLGKNANHSAALGDKTHSRLKEITKLLSSLIADMSLQLTTDAPILTTMGVTGAAVLSAKMPGFKTKVETLQALIHEVESETVYLQ